MVKDRSVPLSPILRLLEECSEGKGTVNLLQFAGAVLEMVEAEFGAVMYEMLEGR